MKRSIYSTEPLVIDGKEIPIPEPVRYEDLPETRRDLLQLQDGSENNNLAKVLKKRGSILNLTTTMLTIVGVTPSDVLGVEYCRTQCGAPFISEPCVVVPMTADVEWAVGEVNVTGESK